MRITNGSDPVFDKLVTGKDKYLFNLLYRIRRIPVPSWPQTTVPASLPGAIRIRRSGSG